MENVIFIYIRLFYKNSNLHTYESIYVAMSNINFQFSIISKWLAKHIITRDSYKITIRKRQVYIDIGWPWICNQCSYLGIWNDDPTKIILLPSFQLATQLNSQNANETEFINEIWFTIFLWLLVFPIGIIEISTSRKYFCWHYFSSLHDYCPPSTWNSLVHTSWVEKKRCDERAFQLLKMRKEISINIKTKCVTDFLLTVRSSSMKDYTCHYVVST